MARRVSKEHSRREAVFGRRYARYCTVFRKPYMMYVVTIVYLPCECRKKFYQESRRADSRFKKSKYPVGIQLAKQQQFWIPTNTSNQDPTPLGTPGDCEKVLPKGRIIKNAKIDANRVFSRGGSAMANVNDFVPKEDRLFELRVSRRSCRAGKSN